MEQIDIKSVNCKVLVNKFIINPVFIKIYLWILPVCLSISTITNAQSVGGTISGATAVCPKSPNSGFLMLSGYVGTILYWESSTDGGITWNNIGNPINSYSYSNLTKTTCYRAIVRQVPFPADTSSSACITIITPSIGGAVNGGGAFCAIATSDTLNLTGYTGKILYWQYSTNGGTSWTTVADTTPVLVYPSLTQNTIYWAVVQNGIGCPADTSSQSSFIIDSLTVAGTISGSDTVVCYGVNAGTLRLSGNIGSILNWISSTDNGANWTPLSNTTVNQAYNALLQTTLFAAIVQSGSCNADTAFTSIVVRAPLSVNAGNDTTIIEGASLQLNGSGSGTALWSPSTGLNNDTLFTPTATPTVTTNYILTVTDLNGCVNRDSVLITVRSGEFEMIISNLFTPDGDGINETWYIKDIQEFPDNEVFIYNIYGNEVYHKKNYANDWQGTYNGSALPDGTYYYVLKLDDASKAMKGSLDILKKK